MRNKWKNISPVYPKRKHLKIEELDKIPYYNENQQVINHLKEERLEQWSANDFIMPHYTVLELGARYGTVSAVINNKLENPRAHVAIEPDPNVLVPLLVNRQLHKSKFTVVAAAITNRPKYINNAKYATSTSSNTEHGTPIKTMTMERLMNITNLNFDCLVADCEGCLEEFLNIYGNYIKNYKMVMYEKDFPDICNYKKISKKMRKWGFHLSMPGFVSVWEKEPGQNVKGSKKMNIN